MNEWGFIGQVSKLVFGKSATSFKFINRCGLLQVARLLVFTPHWRKSATCALK